MIIVPLLAVLGFMFLCQDHRLHVVLRAALFGRFLVGVDQCIQV